MALDTADKRASSFGVGLPFLRVFPAPDGALSQGDRQHTALSYRGIAAGLPGDVISGPFFSAAHHSFSPRSVVGHYYVPGSVAAHYK